MYATTVTVGRFTSLDASSASQGLSWKHRNASGAQRKVLLKNSLRAATPSRSVVKTRAGMPYGMPEEDASALDKYNWNVKEGPRFEYRKLVYGVPEWKRHRSAYRYFRNISSIPDSQIVRGLVPPLAVCTVIAALVTGNNVLSKTMADEYPYLHELTLSTQPFTMSAAFLSLLLVFRTNASYTRWLDSRKMWGLLLNRSRDIARQATTWFAEEDKELKGQFVRYVAAFPIALKAHLRGDPEIEDNLKAVLTPDEVAKCMATVHRPNHCLSMMSSIINKANIDPILATRMDDNLTAFADIVGGCERIFKTPIPLSYTRHTSRFLTSWLCLLPFALYSSCGYYTAPAEFFVAFFLLGVEEIGVQIEEPFSILALDVIGNSAKIGSEEMYENMDIVEGLVNEKAPPAIETSAKLIEDKSLMELKEELEEAVTAMGITLPAAGAAAPATAAETVYRTVKMGNIEVRVAVLPEGEDEVEFDSVAPVVSEAESKGLANLVKKVGDILDTKNVKVDT